MVRRIKPVVSRDKYRRVAEKLHKILLRKEKENGGVFRHALGWYTMNIGNAHKDIDHHVLKQFYLDHFDAVITD
jgi:rhamnogalacturonyl hydrolase YesR